MISDLYLDPSLPEPARQERQVQRMAARWHGAPPIRVARSPADMPVAAPDDARGLYTGDGVWVVAGQPLSELARTLVHEVVAHHGLRQSLGAAWAGFMSAINSGARGSCDHLQDVREGVAWAYDGTDLSLHGVADEMAAAVAERLAHPRTGELVADWPLTKRAVAAWGHARREVLLMDSPASYAELEGALLLADDRLRHGGRVFGIGRKVRGWYAALVSKPWHAQPPMSLAESESLLRAEQYRRDNWIALEVIGLVVAVVALTGWLLFALLGLIFKL